MKIQNRASVSHHHALHDRPRALRRTMAAFGAALLLGTAPLAGAAVSPAQAQAQVDLTAEFHTALSPYGEWRHVARWGDVWVPGHVAQGWRPYTVGHWVYTADWGWYWVSDAAEAEWGWIVYHYGRWVIEPDIGWVWVPDRHWAPAWVLWRRGEHRLGWAPLPPQQLVVEYRTYPRAWIFVPAHEFTVENIATVVLPPREVDVAFRETVVVNETVVEHGRVAVDPGIEPDIVAAEVGRPIHAYEVRPEVLAGTTAVANGVEIGAEQLRHPQQFRPQLALRQTPTELRPARNIPQPQPLRTNEHGRLGNHPPRAAEAAPNGNGQQNPQNALAPEPGREGRNQDHPQNAMRGPAEHRAQRNAPQGPSASQGGRNALRGHDHGALGANREAAGSQHAQPGVEHGPAAANHENQSRNAMRGPEHGFGTHGSQRNALQGPERGPAASNQQEHHASRGPTHGLHQGAGLQHAQGQAEHHPAAGPKGPQSASRELGHGTNGETRSLYNSIRPQGRGAAHAGMRGAEHSVGHHAAGPEHAPQAGPSPEHRSMLRPGGPGAERAGLHGRSGPALAAHERGGPAAGPEHGPVQRMAGPGGGSPRGGPAGGPGGHQGGPGGGRRGAGGPP